MGLEDAANLLIAASGLAVVRLIRDAIRTADISSGRGQPATALGPSPNIPPRLHIHPEPVYEPRRHIQPEPRVERRTVLYTVVREVRIEEQLNLAAATVAAAPTPAEPIACERPLPPPWRMPLPVPGRETIPPRRVIKIIRYQPDIRHSGAMVDVHI